MAPMVNKTVRAQKYRCHYGRRCCPNTLDLAGGKRKRRTVKRGERQAWRAEVRRGDI